MSGQPSVSVRQWIQWESDPHPLEPTTTLVLTTPSGAFVDVRVFLPTGTPHPHSHPNPSLDHDDDGDGEAHHHRPLPIPLHHPALTTATAAASSSLPWTSLDWAFAGTSVREPLSTSPSSSPSSPRKTRCTWTHTISSRFTHPSPENSSDTGVMTPQTVLSAIQAEAVGAGKGMQKMLYEYEYDLEEGSMLNPASGKMEAYEEAWVEVAPVIDSIASFTLEDGREGNVIGDCDVGDDDDGSKNDGSKNDGSKNDGSKNDGSKNDGSKDGFEPRASRVYTVLQPRLDTHLRGTIIRIGDWAQGIARLGEVCAVERWMVSENENESGETGEKERGWVRLVSVFFAEATGKAEGGDGGGEGEKLRRALRRGMEGVSGGGGGEVGEVGGGDGFGDGFEWEVVEHGVF